MISGSALSSRNTVVQLQDNLQFLQHDAVRNTDMQMRLYFDPVALLLHPPLLPFCCNLCVVNFADSL
jgi:hypothetical protein